MANANSTVERLQSFDPLRHDVAIKAAEKIEVLFDALITHADCADQYEDLIAAISVVRAVAMRGTTLASALIRTLSTSAPYLSGDPRHTTEGLRNEVCNG